MNVYEANVFNSVHVHVCVCVCVCVPKIEKSDVSIAIYVVKVIVFLTNLNKTRSVNVRHCNVTM